MYVVKVSARAIFRGTMDWLRKIFTNPKSVEANAYKNLEKEMLLSRLESVIRIDPESGGEMYTRIITQIGWLSLVRFKVLIDLQRALKMTEGEVTTGEETLMNRNQCKLLLRKLSELQFTVEVVAKSRPLDEIAESLVEDLQRVVRSTEALIKGCCISHSSRRLVTAILHVDMKESFSRILYDLQWYRLLLLSIMANTSGDAHSMLEQAMCTELSGECETLLLRAVREDRKSLMECIKSWELNDSEQLLADQLLKNLQEQLATEDGKESSAIIPTPPHFLRVQPKDLKFMGFVIGEGRSMVRSTSWLGSTFAMKECHIGFRGEYSTGCVSELPDEIAAFRKLGRHPNIVPLLCYAVHGDKYFLVMEQMHTDLGAYLRELKREGVHLSMVSAIAMMLQIAEGVKYIHSKKMAHRDIKSPNILLNLANPDDVRSRICAVKIADFGLTKMKDATRTHDNQTLGTGTTRWMAPEAFKVAPGSMAKSRLNARKIDVYSFAIVCAEILSLDNPFPDVLNIREHVRAGHRPILPADCPDKLTTLIKICWDPRPQDRPEFEAICTELRYIKGILLRGLRTSPEKGENQADAVEIEMTTTKLIWRFMKNLGWECTLWRRSLERLEMALFAGLCLLHYVRNILLLWVYFNLWKTRYPFSGCSGPFFLYLVFVTVGPLLAAVACKVIVALEEYPVRSAYLLPFVWLRRFIVGVFKPMSSASGSDTTKSLDMESVFAAFVAVGSGLQTIFQFTILHFIVITEVGLYGLGWMGYGRWDPETVLTICLVFSFLSASCNMGRAIMYQMKKKWAFILNATGIVGGIYTFGALFLRCTTVASIVLQLWNPSSKERFMRDTEVSFAALVSVAILYFGIGVCLLSYSIGLLLVSSNKNKRNARSWETQLEVTVVACINAIIGTLYPIVRYGYKGNNSGNPRRSHCKCIALATSLNMLPDVLAWITLAALQKSPCGQHYPLIMFRRDEDCHSFKGNLGLVLVLAILSCNLCFWLLSASISGLATYHVEGGWCQYVPSQSVVVSEQEDTTSSDSCPMDKLV